MGCRQTPPGHTHPGQTHTHLWQTPPPQAVTAADGTHPTGMHSCSFFHSFTHCFFLFSFFLSIFLLFYPYALHVSRVHLGPSSNLSLRKHGDYATIRVRLYCCETERDSASRLVHGESNLMFILSSDKDRRKNLLSRSFFLQSVRVCLFCFFRGRGDTLLDGFIENLT